MCWAFNPFSIIRCMANSDRNNVQIAQISRLIQKNNITQLVR